jgi:hypothetical protein
MSFTAQSVIDMARSLWREAAVNDILSNAQCLPFINQSVIKIREKRPESQIDASGNLAAFVTVSEVGTEIPLDMKYQLACVYFLTAHGFGRSADLQNLDKRFGDWMGLYEKEVMSA